MDDFLAEMESGLIRNLRDSSSSVQITFPTHDLMQSYPNIPAPVMCARCNQPVATVESSEFGRDEVRGRGYRRGPCGSCTITPPNIFVVIGVNNTISCMTLPENAYGRSGSAGWEGSRIVEYQPVRVIK